MKDKLIFFGKNWKLGVHLLFRTKRFGVNNEWWSTYDSMWGFSWYRKVWNIISVVGVMDNYKAMKFRATACHFITDENKRIIGWI